ncbi:cobalamin biosynthesis protein CbiX [Chitinimonas arctica]|uniref:Cobalamin biosynthesis protein CbiX n=1 Tax=Chitinimonas arctica TaxID=2594795 RepID=A0A516SGX4_9NEIS|nr:CbiX/SirB N-terminal domain-containing protein [Chitinimonas arctica]QDQ27382.1 cobalamin biosynthesis protein CbiX [Chitinimonas arctica]
MPTQHAFILFAHGARDPQWALPFRQLAESLSLRRPDCLVRLAFLELMTPSLADCVDALCADGVTEIQIVPAFMATGAHLRRDLPELVEALQLRHPGISLHVSTALGEALPVQHAMADWIAGLCVQATASSSDAIGQTSAKAANTG